MRKLIGLLILFAVGLSIAAPSNIRANSGSTEKQHPYGVMVYDLHTRNTVSAYDTLATTECNVYGPYNLCPEDGAVPTTMKFQADIATGTSPVISFEYQIIGSFNIKDTLAGAWIAADTVAEAIQDKVITLSGAGHSILFRLNNYDGTSSYIPGLVRVILYPNLTVYRKK